MMLPTFGIVRQMKLVGEHPDHIAIRQRTEARLQALKASGRLTEDKSNESTTSRDCRSAYNNERNTTLAERCGSIGSYWHATDWFDSCK